ncbi:MAG: hypothetical protein VXZ88_07070, partial [Verrucomicrobiota bacterium]|nr:hypothetical protein [Verrucomicrobiota bacterium]
DRAGAGAAGTRPACDAAVHGRLLRAATRHGNARGKWAANGLRVAIADGDGDPVAGTAAADVAAADAAAAAATASSSGGGGSSGNSDNSNSSDNDSSNNDGTSSGSSSRSGGAGST